MQMVEGIVGGLGCCGREGGSLGAIVVLTNRRKEMFR